MARRLIAAALAVLTAPLPAAAEESARDAICRIVEEAAAAEGLPVEFLTRLIWRESSFRKGVTSPAGAQGIAQFMPRTAAERGLADPFDPEEAIPESARYLAELRLRFGNLGLAAAAYNAGPTRIADWRAGDAVLPEETRAHVAFITGREPDDWVAEGAETPALREALAVMTPPRACREVLAEIRVTAPQAPGTGIEGVVARWGVQLVGGPNKDRALKDFARLQKRFGKVLGGHQPTILTTRLGGRGARKFYRIRVAFEGRRDAEKLCRRLRAAGGSCLAVPN